MGERTVFEAAGGYDGLLRLAHAWHERCLADPVASHPFGHPGEHPDHLARLAAYWAEALGGPAGYTGAPGARGLGGRGLGERGLGERGLGDHSHVLRLHAGNGEHHELDERAIACFDAALEDTGLAEDERLRATLSAYFRWGTVLMAAHPETPADVPAGLPLPHWSWDGPVRAPVDREQ